MKFPATALLWVGGGVAGLVLFFLISWCVDPSQVCHVYVQSFDTFFAYNTPNSIFAHTALFFTYLANSEIIIAVAAIVCAVLILVHQKYIAALAVFGLTLGGASALYFKLIFFRDRPTDFMYLLPRSGYSFPSGHALVAIVFYGFLGYCLFESIRRRAYKMLTLLGTCLLILTIGYSRILLGYHWPSDVVGGWVVGFSILCFLIATLQYSRHVWPKGRFPRGLSAGIVTVLIVIMGFWIMAYYVTHPLEIRSMIVE